MGNLCGRPRVVQHETARLDKPGDLELLAQYESGSIPGVASAKVGQQPQPQQPQAVPAVADPAASPAAAPQS